MLIVPHREFRPPAGLLAREWLRDDRGLYVPERRIRLPGRDVDPRLRRATITITNIGTNSTASGSSVGVTAVTIAAGNLVLVAVEDNNTAAGTGVTDTQSNTYAPLTSVHPNNSSTNGTTQLFWSVLAHALTGSDTITYTSAGTSKKIAVSALFGNSTTGWLASPVDTAVTATAFGSSSPAAGTGGTPGQSGELWIGVVGISAGASPTITNGAPWAIPPNTNNTQAGASIGGGTQVGNASAPSYSATLSGGMWGLIIAAFIPAAATLTLGGSRIFMM